MDITRLPSASLSTREVDTGLSDRDRDEYFPLMKLPTELRLMVYENWTSETRRALPLIFGEIFFQDLDLDPLQVSKDVRREAKSILLRHHENLTISHLQPYWQAETVQEKSKYGIQHPLYRPATR
jgi:hypothetical protein